MTKSRKNTGYLGIGETAKRAGVAPSALRFYESRGLISSVRGIGNQRQFHRSMLRRISTIKIAQNLGLSLNDIEEAFTTLPDERTPTRRDWQRLSKSWRKQLDNRIQGLILLREKLDGCIGCGCLSINRCALYNPGDEASKAGAGARFLVMPD